MFQVIHIPADGLRLVNPRIATVFGTGIYLGATFIESDFRAFGSYRLGNFEVFATSADGMVDHYWRENGGAFVWNGPFRVAENAGGAPSAAYSGAPILDAYGGSYHGESSFWVVWPIAARPRGPGKLGS